MDFLTKYDLAAFEGCEAPEDEVSNFALSFKLLKTEERNAIQTVYAFCSYIDDIVDEPNNTDEYKKIKLGRLEFWKNTIEKIYNGNSLRSGHLAPIYRLTERYNIPRQYFNTIIDGCRRDLIQNRYETFEELKEYCYGVAGVVGLMSIEIFGYKYEETKTYAVNLGYALQLTNIIRDVKFDMQRNYIYLPQEDLRRFNYSEADLAANKYNDNFIELMRFQAARAREYYHKARTSLRPDERSTVFSAEIMDAIYYRLLEKIELNEFRIFDKKIRVSTPHKLYLTFKHWISAHLLVERLKQGKGKR